MSLADELFTTAYDLLFKGGGVRRFGGPDDPQVDQANRLAEEIRTAVREVTGINLGEVDNEEAVEALRRTERAGRITQRQVQEAIDTMPVSYSQWVSIAFRIAKRKGFQPSSEFASGNANAQMIELAAEIWNDRKQEMASVRRAEEIAQEEISVA